MHTFVHAVVHTTPGDFCTHKDLNYDLVIFVQVGWYDKGCTCTPSISKYLSPLIFCASKIYFVCYMF
jgi:hypothetical protein